MKVTLPDGSIINVRIVRKPNMRNIRVHAELDGEIWISMPQRCSLQEAQEAVESFMPWIMEKREMATSGGDGPEFTWILGKKYPIEFERSDTLAACRTENSLKVEAPSRAYIGEVVDYWKKQYAAQVFAHVVDEWHRRLKDTGIPRPVISVRKMKTRWGSCSYSKGTIRLNSSLIDRKFSLIQYVVLHELAHFLYPNHGAEFKAFLTKEMPDWQERSEELNRPIAEVTEETVEN